MAYDDGIKDILANMPDESPHKNRNKIIIAVIVVIVVAIAAILGAFFLAKNNSKPDEPEDLSQSIEAIDVSNETSQRMADGTILSFGGEEGQVETVTIIADPSDMSREGNIVNGSPSDLLNAVKSENIRLNLYLSPSEDSHNKGADSMVKAAACAITSDESEGNIQTLFRMVRAAGEFTGDESTAEIANKMKADEDMDCPATSGDAASSTSNNALHFMTQYQMSEPNLVVSNGSGVTDFSRLTSDWVEKALNGDSAEDFVSNNEGN